MGTRADFYVGRGKRARWIGSIAYDGHPENYHHICTRRQKHTFERAVRCELLRRDDATFPRDGWPWAWDDSNTTDEVFCFDKGRVRICHYGRWFTWESYVKYLNDPEDHLGPRNRDNPFPNMSARRSMAHGHRSGFLLFA